MSKLREFLEAGMSVQEISKLLRMSPHDILVYAGDDSPLDPVYLDYLGLVLQQRGLHSPIDVGRHDIQKRLLRKEEFINEAGRFFRARNEQSRVLIAFIDLDNLKEINDQHGHLTGDRVIERFSVQILKCKRQNDVACRFGGDEFVLLMDCASNSTHQMSSLENRLCKLLISGVEVSASIGFKEGVVNRTNWLIDLLSHIEAADKAMYASKRSKRKVHA